jgi:hypothetical protein
MKQKLLVASLNTRNQAWPKIPGKLRKKIDNASDSGQDFAIEDSTDRTNHNSSSDAPRASGAGARASEVGCPARWRAGGQSRDRPD